MEQQHLNQEYMVATLIFCCGQRGTHASFRHGVLCFENRFGPADAATLTDAYVPGALVSSLPTSARPHPHLPVSVHLNNTLNNTPRPSVPAHMSLLDGVRVESGGFPNDSLFDAYLKQREVGGDEVCCVCSVRDRPVSRPATHPTVTPAPHPTSSVSFPLVHSIPTTHTTLLW